MWYCVIDLLMPVIKVVIYIMFSDLIETECSLQLWFRVRAMKKIGKFGEWLTLSLTVTAGCRQALGSSPPRGKVEVGKGFAVAVTRSKCSLPCDLRSLALFHCVCVCMRHVHVINKTDQLSGHAGRKHTETTNSYKQVDRGIVRLNWTGHAHSNIDAKTNPFVSWFGLHRA